MSRDSRKETNPAARNPASAPLPPPQVNLPDLTPVMTEAQRVAAQTSVSGRRAVSRGTMFMAFYLWLLSGVVLLSFFAQRTQFFPGDMLIAGRLQKYHNRWVRRFFFGISEIGFPKFAVPVTLATGGIFWLLRFRLEAIFILASASSSTLLNALVKRVIKRPRPTKELVTVVRTINEPSFPSGHVMHYTNFYGLMIYLLATNWRSGKLRNILIAICTILIACIGPSRVYLGAHWPSDVLAGYMYGGLWFAGIMALYLRIKAWIHPPAGKSPEIAKPLQQPGDEDDE
ncbi:MAG TPA: phosphatase PAP2 family protein [Ktedonobacteraceae bacterium]|jgi:membrane-associated phospholipid phosphatase|nr:phosphatase PAP2 family protein [Ktedonobacteraceae bacterium]